MTVYHEGTKRREEHEAFCATGLRGLRVSSRLREKPSVFEPCRH
jgi:tRNA G26 N,N-dimethylase Trm1